MVAESGWSSRAKPSHFQGRAFFCLSLCLKPGIALACLCLSLCMKPGMALAEGRALTFEATILFCGRAVDFKAELFLEGRALPLEQHSEASLF